MDNHAQVADEDQRPCSLVSIQVLGCKFEIIPNSSCIPSTLKKCNIYIGSLEMCSGRNSGNPCAYDGDTLDRLNHILLPPSAEIAEIQYEKTFSKQLCTLIGTYPLLKFVVVHESVGRELHRRRAYSAKLFQGNLCDLVGENLECTLRLATKCRQ
jgi:hypothetical protein